MSSASSLRGGLAPTPPSWAWLSSCFAIFVVLFVPPQIRRVIGINVRYWFQNVAGEPDNRNQVPGIVDIVHSASTFCSLPISRSSQSQEDKAGLLVETIGDHPVAFGGYSDVWQGTMRVSGSPDIALVAVKILRRFGGGSGLRKRLHREVRVWKLLHHESISIFHGDLYNSNGNPAIISPWYTNGSADFYLQRHPEADPMKLIWEIVLGVEYLHDNDVVHGDLKGANVMVDDTGHAKLIDFGLSRIIESVTGATGFTATSLSFSTRWCAPELVLSDNAQVTKASDVYACASTILELLTGEVPYSSQKERTVLLTVLKKVPPPRPSGPLRYSIVHADKLWELLGECWTDVLRRPSISEVKRRMRPFYSGEPNVDVRHA